MNKVFFIIFTLIHCAVCVKNIYCVKSFNYDFMHMWNPTIYDTENEDFNTCVIVIDNDPKNINNDFANLVVINCEKSMCDIVANNMTVLENEKISVFCPRMFTTYLWLYIVMLFSLNFSLICCLCYYDEKENENNVEKVEYCYAIPPL